MINEQRKMTALGIALSISGIGISVWVLVLCYRSGHSLMGISLDLVILILDLLVFMLFGQHYARKKIEMLAYLDPLTQIWNANKFRSSGEKLLSKDPDQYSVVSIDINRFQYINSIFGFRSGDLLLESVAGILRESARKDEAYARNAGDNFLLLLHEADKDHLLERLREMNGKAAQYTRPLYNDFPIYFSCGICRAQGRQADLNQLIDQANFARKKAKGHFENACVFYEGEIRKASLLSRIVETHMQKALTGREFYVFLQPKVSFQDGLLEGAEALVRWKSPELGELRPDQFIPLFEENGFISNLDFYMFENVCALLEHWSRIGKQPVRISVNFSRVHLYEENFAERLEQIFRNYQIPAGWIELEITERAAAESSAQLMKVLEKIHKIGFTLSIDDFGTGYSSLSLLKDLPVDVIKIDRSFLYGNDKERLRIVVKKIAELARALHMQTVVEGVETGEQADFLRGIGCDLAQGFLYYRPMPAAEFEKLLPMEITRGLEPPSDR